MKFQQTYEYQQGADYLPVNGSLFVDTSAISWTGQNSGENWIDQHIIEKRYNDLNSIFKSRKGGISTTPLVLEEILDGVNFFGGLEKEFRRRKSDLRSFGRGGKNSKNKKPKNLTLPRLYNEERKINKRILHKSRKIYNLLEKNLTEIQVEKDFRIEECLSYYFEKSDGVSFADQELIRGAVYNGKNTGIFSADNSLIKTYVKSIKELQIPGCFVSQAHKYSTREINIDF
jgi:hypothetical protein